MQDANRDAGASHCVDCGYGVFCKRSPDVLYCKTALSGSYAELYNLGDLLER